MSENSALPDDLPSPEPLGCKHPLLPANPLGQSWLQPKFLTPLGTRSLSVLDPTIFDLEEPIADLPPPEFGFADLPTFFPSHLSRPPSQLFSNPPDSNPTRPIVPSFSSQASTAQSAIVQSAIVPPQQFPQPSSRPSPQPSPTLQAKFQPALPPPPQPSQNADFTSQPPDPSASTSTPPFSRLPTADLHFESLPDENLPESIDATLEAEATESELIAELLSASSAPNHSAPTDRINSDTTNSNTTSSIESNLAPIEPLVIETNLIDPIFENAIEIDPTNTHSTNTNSTVNSTINSINIDLASIGEFNTSALDASGAEAIENSAIVPAFLENFVRSELGIPANTESFHADNTAKFDRVSPSKNSTQPPSTQPPNQVSSDRPVPAIQRKETPTLPQTSSQNSQASSNKSGTFTDPPNLLNSPVLEDVETDARSENRAIPESILEAIALPSTTSTPEQATPNEPEEVGQTSGSQVSFAQDFVQEVVQEVVHETDSSLPHHSEPNAPLSDPFLPKFEVVHNTQNAQNFEVLGDEINEDTIEAIDNIQSVQNIQRKVPNIQATQNIRAAFESSSEPTIATSLNPIVIPEKLASTEHAAEPEAIASETSLQPSQLARETLLFNSPSPVQRAVNQSNEIFVDSPAIEAGDQRSNEPLFDLPDLSSSSINSPDFDLSEPETSDFNSFAVDSLLADSTTDSTANSTIHSSLSNSSSTAPTAPTTLDSLPNHLLSTHSIRSLHSAQSTPSISPPNSPAENSQLISSQSTEATELSEPFFDDSSFDLFSDLSPIDSFSLDSSAGDSSFTDLLSDTSLNEFSTHSEPPVTDLSDHFAHPSISETQPLTQARTTPLPSAGSSASTHPVQAKLDAAAIDAANLIASEETAFTAEKTAIARLPMPAETLNLPEHDRPSQPIERSDEPELENQVPENQLLENQAPAGSFLQNQVLENVEIEHRSISNLSSSSFDTPPNHSQSGFSSDSVFPNSEFLVSDPAFPDSVPFDSVPFDRAAANFAPATTTPETAAPLTPTPLLPHSPTPPIQPKIDSSIVSVPTLNSGYSLPPLPSPKREARSAGSPVPPGSIAPESRGTEKPGSGSTSKNTNPPPDAWSSIEELLGQAGSPATPVIQRFTEDLAPNSIAPDPFAALSSPNYTDNNATASAIAAIDARFNAPANATNNGLSHGANPTDSDTTHPGGDPGAAGDAESLEALAREVYNLLRQRLEIERERQGLYYYYGRSSW